MSELIMGYTELSYGDFRGVSGYHRSTSRRRNFLLDLGSTNGTFVNGAKYLPTTDSARSYISSANYQLGLSDAIEAFINSLLLERSPAMNSDQPSNHVQHTGIRKSWEEKLLRHCLAVSFISAQHIRVSIQGRLDYRSMRVETVLSSTEKDWQHMFCIDCKVTTISFWGRFRFHRI